MTFRIAPLLLVLLTVAPAYGQRLPRLVPPGWTQVSADPETKTRRFRSQDGRSSLIARQSIANPSALAAEMDRIARRDGEIITYQKRGRSWIAVSGYRGNHLIFYRKSNLACGGTRWHHIELLYPREEKRQMDATVTGIAHGMTLYSNDCPSRPQT